MSLTHSTVTLCLNFVLKNHKETNTKTYVQPEGNSFVKNWNTFQKIQTCTVNIAGC